MPVVVVDTGKKRTWVQREIQPLVFKRVIFEIPKGKKIRLRWQAVSYLNMELKIKILKLSTYSRI